MKDKLNDKDILIPKNTMQGVKNSIFTKCRFVLVQPSVNTCQKASLLLWLAVLWANFSHAERGAAHFGDDLQTPEKKRVTAFSLTLWLRDTNAHVSIIA